MVLKLKLMALLSLFILANNIFSQINMSLNSRLGKEYSGKTAHYITSTSLDSIVYNIIEDVNEDSVEYFIQSLQDFGTRYYNAPNRKEIAEWIVDQFRGFGLQDVVIDSFSVGNTYQYNVIATLHAVTNTDKVFVIGAHHDSITGSSPMQTAPGADDNASGTAGVLEIARVLMDNEYEPDANIKFITFAAEEIGLYGSRDFAKKAKDSGMNIRLMINHDMISYSPYSVKESRLAINHYSGSENFTDIALYCADNFTRMQIFKESLNSAGSDSYSFFQEGFNSVYFEEHDFTPFYHTNSDLIVNNNIPYCSEVIKASCATLIYSLALPEAVEIVSIADKQEGTAMYVEWEYSSEDDFKEYKIYVGESADNYNREFTTTNNNILIDELITGTEYFVGVSVIDQDGYESSIVQESFIPFLFKLDQGILIVDETADGSGTIMKPTDEEVDNFYEELFRSYNISSFDVIQNEALSVADIGNYSTVIWHGDDLTNLTAARLVIDELKRYMDAGGNFIYSGYQPALAFENNRFFEATFSEGSFLYDYLKIESMTSEVGTRFYGGISNSDNYEDLYVDTSKVKASLGFHLQKIESISANSSANNIYFYETLFDTSSNQGVLKGLPVAVEYIGDDYNAVTLSFPLYYINKEQAKMFIDKVIGEKFREPTGAEEYSAVPAEFVLSQNYPNPFNPETTIEYSLPAKVNSESLPTGRQVSIVKLTVYDILGREVATLVNGNKNAGSYKVTFDASSLTSGVYFYTLRAGDHVDSKKMILIK